METVELWLCWNYTESKLSLDSQLDSLHHYSVALMVSPAVGVSVLRKVPFKFSCFCLSIRILTILTFEIGATFTGGFSLRTPSQPKKWSCLRSRWSRRRRTSLSPRCWTSWSATSARWPLCTTSPPTPLWKGATGSIANTCQYTTGGKPLT